MIIALFSDIHSNAEALDACLKHAREQRVDRYAFLGDLVGYGADPRAVVDIVARYAAEGAVVVKGNHDLAVERRRREMNEVANDAIEWTRGVLSEEQKAFLAGLPFCVREESICFVHASAEDPEGWEYIESSAAAARSIEAATTTYTFSGHVHDQVLYFQTLTGKTAPFHPTSGSPVPVPSHRKWLATVGSVGQPRDRNLAAAYALFDSEREEMTFFRVPYDHIAAARKIRRAGLPESLAQRIEEGI
ncbi:MAG TPA: metallophosphoesterase family protein [Thermoanaerobaculia bacterium]|nr:metallophosphoesterase family protein [Thermoanaerobaculia bacterium]